MRRDWTKAVSYDKSNEGIEKRPYVIKIVLRLFIGCSGLEACLPDSRQVEGTSGPSSLNHNANYQSSSHSNSDTNLSITSADVTGLSAVMVFSKHVWLCPGGSWDARDRAIHVE